MDPVSTSLLISSLAMSGAGLGYSIFGGSKPKAPDISGELARIRQLYAQARENAIAGINAQAAAGRTQQVSNLAARGTYRSPVAQNVFSALEAARLQSIGKAEGELYGAEAGATQSALGQLMGLNLGYQQMEQQRQAGIGAALGSFGGSLMGAGLSMYNQPKAAPVSQQAFGGGGGQAPMTSFQNPQIPVNQYNMGSASPYNYMTAPGYGVMQNQPFFMTPYRGR